MGWKKMLLVAGVGLLVACAGEPDQTPDAPATGQPGGQARTAPVQADAQGGHGEGTSLPSLALDTLDGTRFDLAAMRGEWVVVNFWATWCAPCLKEIPDLSALHDARADLTVIGLAYEDIEPQDMREFLVRVPASYPIAIIDPYAAAPAGDFATPRGLPMTYLIAPDGSVARRFLGPVTSEEINQAIDEHVAG